MSYVDEVLARVIAKNPSEPEFHQAVTEVFETIRPVIEEKEDFFRKEAILERITEPERMIKFRVPWVDDKGNVQVNMVSVFSSIAQSDLTKVAYVSIHL